MKECCIGIGNCSYFYYFILGSILFNIISYFSLYFSESLNNCEIMKSLYKYFGFIIFGIIFYFISDKNSKSKIEKKAKRTSNKNKLIYNNIFKLSKKVIILLILVCLIYVIYIDLEALIDFLGFYDFEFWTFDIIFILWFMSIYIPTKIYAHQKYSMIFIIILDSILLIIASFLPGINENNEYINIYQKTGNILICIFFIIFYIVLSALMSYARVKGKILIDYKYISPYKMIIIIGLFGFVINVSKLIYSIVNEVACNDIKKPDLQCYFSISNYINNWKGSFLEIILTFFYIISSFMSMTCEIYIIKYLNPNYLLMSDNIYYEFIKIINIINESNQMSVFSKFVILQLAELLELIGCLIYLEIIELRFCGLNTYLKKNIIKRAEFDLNEARMSLIDNDNSLNNDDIENQIEMI